MTHPATPQNRPAYTAYAPLPGLRPYVLCLWSLHAPEKADAPSTIRVLPDGCMDMIFDAGGCLSPAAVQPPATPSSAFFITSPTQTPETIRIQGRVEVVGIRFRPYGATAFLNYGAGDFTDGVHAEGILPAHLASGIRDIMSGDDTLDPKIHRIQLLLSRLCSRRSGPDGLTRRAVELLAGDHGQSAIARTAERMGISRRTLERAFGEHIGISPKRLSKIIRLRHAISLLRAAPSPSLAHTAQTSGYADQAHFTREFKQMTEVTPLRFMEEHRHVAFVQYDLPRLG